MLFETGHTCKNSPQSLGRSTGNGPESARLHMGTNRRGGLERHRDIARDHIGEAGHTALIRDVGDFEAHAVLELLHGQVRYRAVA